MNIKGLNLLEKNELVRKMKEIIGCTELTHEAVEEYLRPSAQTKAMLPWEHCAMGFYKISCGMSRGGLEHGIHRCVYQGKAYYFGIGLDESVLSDEMLNYGVWSVYTWMD